MKKIVVFVIITASAIIAWLCGREYGFTEAAKLLTHATNCKIKRSWYI